MIRNRLFGSKINEKMLFNDEFRFVLYTDSERLRVRCAHAHVESDIQRRFTVIEKTKLWYGHEFRLVVELSSFFWIVSISTKLRKNLLLLHTPMISVQIFF